MSLVNMQPEGFIRLADGRTLPYLGEVNNISLEKWTRMCEELAIKHFTEDVGHAPESAEEALAYQIAKYPLDIGEKEPIPVVYEAVEIMPAEPCQNAHRGAKTPQAMS